MVLIISENDQIIGADEELLQNNSLEGFRDNFPSMSIFLLQSEQNNFTFEYKNNTYLIKKYSIIMNSQNANLYIFNDSSNSNIDEKVETKNDDTNSKLEIENTPSLNFDLQNEKENINNLEENSNELQIELPNETLSATKTAPSELSMDLGLDLNSNEENKNNKLEIETPKEETASNKTNELSLDFGLDSNILSEPTIEAPKEETVFNQSNELTLDLGLDSNISSEPAIETPKEETVSNKTDELELDLGLDSNISSEPAIETPKEETASNKTNELSLDFGLDSNISSEPAIETPKEETVSNKTDELELDLGLDSNISSEPAIETLKEETVSNKTDELELDLGLNFNEIEEIIQKPKPIIQKTIITEEEIKKDLSQASQELGIDDETLQQFFVDFKQQLIDEKPHFVEAIQEINYNEIHKSAHKLKGVALNLRLNKFAELLKNIDELAKEEADINEIKTIINSIYEIIEADEEVEKIDLDLNLPDDEKTIKLKAFLEFLNTIKYETPEKIREELNNAYNLVAIPDLKNISKLSDTELSKFVHNLEINIKKEIK